MRRDMDRLVITIHPTPSDEGLLRVSDAAISGGKDDLGAPHMLLRRAAIRDDRLEPTAIHWGDVDDNSCSHADPNRGLSLQSHSPASRAAPARGLNLRRPTDRAVLADDAPSVAKSVIVTAGPAAIGIRDKPQARLGRTPSPSITSQTDHERSRGAPRFSADPEMIRRRPICSLCAGLPKDRRTSCTRLVLSSTQSLQFTLDQFKQATSRGV
jgi:hypothetical protein